VQLWKVVTAVWGEKWWFLVNFVVLTAKWKIIVSLGLRQHYSVEKASPSCNFAQ